MSDFKFSCPTCGQHISCDTSNVGMQIPCPGCQTLLTVPPAPEMAPPAVPPGLSIAASQARHTANEASHHASMMTAMPMQQQAADRSQQTMSGLAIASFVCSLFFCVGCLPGIICGHIAQSRIRRDSSLKGGGFAFAGLLISYVSLLVTIGYIAYATTKVVSAVKEGITEAQRQSKSNLVHAVAADNQLWNLNLTTAQFPDRPVRGKLHALDFTVDTATIQNGIITLRQGQNAATGLQVSIFTFMTNGETLAGKTYDISTTDPDLPAGTMPQVHLRWQEDGQTGNKAKVYKTGYALKLEIAAAEVDGKLPAKIYLCLPDPEKSYVAGNFDLEVKKSATKPRKPKKPAAN